MVFYHRYMITFELAFRKYMTELNFSQISHRILTFRDSATVEYKKQKHLDNSLGKNGR